MRSGAGLALWSGKGSLRQAIYEEVRGFGKAAGTSIALGGALVSLGHGPHGLPRGT